MSYLPSLSDDAVLPDLLSAYPEAGGALVAAHTQIMMRGRSAFAVPERELMPPTSLR